LLENVTAIKSPGIVKSWQVLIPQRNGESAKGRICVIRKTDEAIKLAQEKILKDARKKQHITKPETLEYAKYIIVFSNYPEELFSDFDLLEWYRSRWQVELVFKRFKSIAELGHLPKHSDESSKAWLYGKLFVSLLTEKLIRHASSVSPWGYNLEEQPTAERMA
jgi:transposase